MTPEVFSEGLQLEFPLEPELTDKEKALIAQLPNAVRDGHPDAVERLGTGKGDEICAGAAPEEAAG